MVRFTFFVACVSTAGPPFLLPAIFFSCFRNFARSSAFLFRIKWARARLPSVRPLDIWRRSAFPLQRPRCCSKVSFAIVASARAVLAIEASSAHVPFNSSTSSVFSAIYSSWSIFVARVGASGSGRRPGRELETSVGHMFFCRFGSIVTRRRLKGTSPVARHADLMFFAVNAF